MHVTFQCCHSTFNDDLHGGGDSATAVGGLTPIGSAECGVCDAKVETGQEALLDEVIQHLGLQSAASKRHKAE